MRDGMVIRVNYFWLEPKMYGELCRTKNLVFCSSCYCTSKHLFFFKINKRSLEHTETMELSKHVLLYGPRLGFAFYILTISSIAKAPLSEQSGSVWAFISLQYKFRLFACHSVALVRHKIVLLEQVPFFPVIGEISRVTRGSVDRVLCCSSVILIWEKVYAEPSIGSSN